MVLGGPSQAFPLALSRALFLRFGEGFPMSTLASAWQPSVLVLVGATIALCLFAQGIVRLRRRGRRDHAGSERVLLFVLAVAVSALALTSPLDAVAERYLLSAHMLQHLLIADVAPALALVALRGPLIFFLVPGFALRRLAEVRPLRIAFAFLLRPRVSLAAWALVLVAWHVPAAYDYTLRNQGVHELEHASFVLVGLLVWFQLVDPARRKELSVNQRLAYAGLLFGFGEVISTVLLASPAPLYPTYASVHTHLLGISSLQDQRLAGAVMVVEQLLALGACAAFLISSHAKTARPGALTRWVSLTRAAAQSPIASPLTGSKK